MQPYFFPYIGYFQLIAQVDHFIFHDDAQYIKGGWVNRNRILSDETPLLLTLPVLRGAHEHTIQQRAYDLNPRNVGRISRRIEAYYRKAPRFSEILPLLQDILSFGDPNVAAFNANLIGRLAGFLGIGTRLLRASEMTKEDRLRGEARVIDLCVRVGATVYLNPIGGLSLYRAEAFAAAGIELQFLESNVRPYRQFGGTPVPSLSIIDVLMFNSNQTIAAMLKECQIIRSAPTKTG